MITVDNEEKARGTGSSLKKAKEEAAKLTLQSM